MPTSAKEIETKYAVDPDLVLPALDSAPGVATVTLPETFTLEAVYYDTADLRLARDKVTLRRREGGHDAGWHLKLPLGPGERLEVRSPLEEQVPAALADLVAARIRTAPLLPVARITTVRTVRELRGADGTSFAEVADDKVRGRVLQGPADGRETGWRELEVELLGAADTGVLAGTGTLLLAAGARPAASGSKLAHVLGAAADLPPDLPAPAAPHKGSSRKRPAGGVVRDYLLEQARALVAADPGVRTDVEDAVHQQRVACRRLRSALRTFRPLLDGGDHLEGELRWLAAELGAARDAEVLLERLEADLAALPAELVLGPVTARLQEDLRPRLLAARAHAVGTLRGERYLALLDDLVAFAAAPPFTAAAAGPARRVLPPLVRRAFRKVERRVAAAWAAPHGDQRDLALHDVRKAAKQLRYAAESVAAAFGADAATLGKRAKAVQEVLGEHQDIVVMRQVLRRLGAAPGENGFTFGVLLGAAEERADSSERDLAPAWKRLSRPAVTGWLG